MTATLLALPVLASAQTSRVEGMALQGDYIKDYTGIYTYTSGVPNVGNLVYGELGTTSSTSSSSSPEDRAIGAVMGNVWDGRFGTWAIHLREMTPALGQGDASSSITPGSLGSDPNSNANEAFDIMWGRKFGTTSLGLRMNRSFFKAVDELPTGTGGTSRLEFDPLALTVPITPGNPNLQRNIVGIGGGLGFEMNPNTNIELAFLYQSRTFEWSETGPAPPGSPVPPPPGAETRRAEDNPGSYLLAARAMWQWQPNAMVIPVFKWYSFDLSQASTAASAITTTDNSLRGWQLGGAVNWTLGTNDLFVFGVTIAQNRVEEETDLFGIATQFPGVGADHKVTETIAPEMFAGLETHTNNWLTLRMGATKGAFNKLKVEDNVSDRKIEYTSSPFKMNLGAGVKLGTLQLDAILNTFFPHTLGGFFGNVSGPTGIDANGDGTPDTNGFVTFPKVTATYAF